MRRTAPASRILSWGGSIAALSLAAALLAVDAVDVGARVGGVNSNWAWAAFPIFYGVIGGLIAGRHPGNPVGWILLFIGIAIGAAGVTAELGALPQAGRAGPGAILIANEALALVYPCGGIAACLLLLPDGRLPSPRWRPLLMTVIVVTAVWLVLQALVPGPLTGLSGEGPAFANPTALPALGWVARTARWIPNVVYVIGGAVLLISATAPLVRAFRARGEEREQVRWIAYVVTLTAAANGVTAALFIVVPVLSDVLNNLILAVNLLGFGVALPLATAVAIFRYRLYDIDLIISRTLVYGSLAVFITAIYIGFAVGIGDLVGSGGQPNLALSVVATAIVALGFEPVRERLQRLANRLVYGPRATPYEVLSEFSERVAGSYAAEDVVPRMARTLAEGTGADQAVVWLRSEARLRPAAGWPAVLANLAPLTVTGQLMPVIPGSDRAVPVRDHGELLGALSVSKRAGESLSAIENNLLQDLANQAGLVLRNVGLTAELVRRMEDLEGSRRRLLAAQDAERQRIERDLQQGAQRNLLALRARLGETRAAADGDPARVREMVRGLMIEADEALQTLRELARGIYPPLLADRGLEAAIDAQLRRMSVPVSVESAGVHRYPREIEAGVYFCLLEALANVQRHAHADRAWVRLADAGGRLTFEVADDGAGFDSVSALRSGLTNITDRLDALGGELHIDSGPGRGTTLTGSLPAPALVPVTV
ncbi:MAG TPA: ATP-binding protein [Candidatus Dormibacteraeota bacterium]|jgi:signal transduction histidine kinase|nr:ATP-binding protein [Candidatus Dormibacteraeota bacterium]